MKIALWVRITAALLPIIISPLVFALGSDGRAGFMLGLMLGAFFGLTLAPFQVALSKEPGA